jgi:hypothetical protein
MSPEMATSIDIHYYYYYYYSAVLDLALWLVRNRINNKRVNIWVITWHPAWEIGTSQVVHLHGTNYEMCTTRKIIVVYLNSYCFKDVRISFSTLYGVRNDVCQIYSVTRVSVQPLSHTCLAAVNV